MKRVFAVLALAAVSAGCNEGDDLVIPVEKSPFPGITLATPAPVTYVYNPVVLRSEGPAGAPGLASAAPTVEGGDGTNYVLVEIARVDAPVVGGQRVQANDIILQQNTAYAAYNTQGNPWVGAVQAIDISQAAHPVVTTEIQFEHMDINAVGLDGNTSLLISGAADPAFSEEGFLAFASRVATSTLDENELATNVVGLSSFAGTGITRHGNSYYVGVGAKDGGIQVLDGDFVPTSALAMPDVRDVESYDGGVIAVAGKADAGGGPGTVVLAPGGNLSSATLLTIDAFDSDHHKATIEVFGDAALLGLSEAGFKVLDLGSGSYLAEIPNPDPVEAGQLTNTNSVSTDGNLVFTANGEYGFRVFRPEDGDIGDLTQIGYIRWDLDNGGDLLSGETYSANHIEAKSKYVFVASGAYGIIIYTLVEQGSCTYTQGFWGTHGYVWPVESLKLGNVTYSKEQLLAILGDASTGNGLINLARQLIAAKLNVASGTDDTAIAGTITQADALIGDLVVGTDSLDPSATSALVDALAAYNEGDTGPGHCDGSPAN